MNKLIFQKIGTGLILYLNEKENSNISEIGRNLQASYSHLFNVAKGLEEIEIIKSEKIGREKKLILTEKGLRIAKLIEEIKANIEDKDYKESEEKHMLTGKLERYNLRINKVLDEIEEKGKVLPKSARVLGRIKYLTLKTRPKDIEKVQLRHEILKNIESIIGGEKN